MLAKSSWAQEEFSGIRFGDKRLEKRLIKICDRFSESPESPINQACEGWAETKAAYHFFGNEKVESDVIMKAHSLKTAERAKQHTTILALQDTSYFIYTKHKATKGLGNISVKEGKNVKQIFSKGLVSHSCLAVTTDGLPLGLLDQNTFARKLHSEETRRLRDLIPIEEKESYRWLSTLQNSALRLKETQVVTVCDREADIYEFFKLSDEIKSPVLVRANVNRAINKKSRYAEKNVIKLWDFIKKKPAAGTFKIEIPAKNRKNKNGNKKTRIATLKLKFGCFRLNPPRNNIKLRKESLPDLEMNAVYVFELHPPKGESPLEWMLLTNLAINNYEEAYEKVRWYSLRWRIEMFFKVLKSGFRVEDCRLGDASRLIKYLTVMSIVAWRLFMITLIARTNPKTPCNSILTEIEWKLLYMKTYKTKPPKTIPKMEKVIIWIARLGGFLARKKDGMPGTTTLWRGWKRLSDLVQGWKLATINATYG